MIVPNLTRPTRLSRLAIALAALTVCLASSGCTVCYNLRRTQCTEPRQFSWKRDHVQSTKLYSEWADQAWLEVGRASAPTASKNYRWGFHDGFVALTYAGGNGEPPGAPPRQFWRAGWRSGAGKQAADEWFAGYRHGAMVAREGGYRDQAVLRSSAATAGFLTPVGVDGFAGEHSYSSGAMLEFPTEIRSELVEPGPPVPAAPAHDRAIDSLPADPGPLPPPEQLLQELEEETSAQLRAAQPISLVSHSQGEESTSQEPPPLPMDVEAQPRPAGPSAETTIEFRIASPRAGSTRTRSQPQNPFRSEPGE